MAKRMVWLSGLLPYEQCEVDLPRFSGSSALYVQVK
jgi:hypothetical protein